MMKKNIVLIASILLSFLLLILISLSAFYFNYNKPENIFDRNISKVVEIKVSNDNVNWGYATGCFIDPNGNILTNKHVVFNQSTNTNYSQIFVRLATSEEFIPAEIKKISNEHDLAIININLKNNDYFNINNSINDGEEIYTIGNPNGFGLSFTSGLISSANRNVIYNERVISVMQTNLVINEGNSGGPVFSKNGDLKGIISFRLRDNKNDIISGVSFAIPAKFILEFI